MEHRDHAVPRSELLRKVWGYENADSVDTRTVDIHITKLRKKIEDDPSHPKLLVTFRGEVIRCVLLRNATSKLEICRNLH